MPPFRFDMPVCVEADVLFDHAADVISLIPGIEQTGELTVSFESGDYRQAYRTIHAMAQIARAAE
jgi:D-aminopeptidase